MNIRLQEVTVDGERSVQYKGSDGKMHNIAAGNGESDGGSTAQEPIFIFINNETINKMVNGEVLESSPEELIESVLANPFTKIVMQYSDLYIGLLLREFNHYSNGNYHISYKAIYNDANAGLNITYENSEWHLTKLWEA